MRQRVEDGTDIVKHLKIITALCRLVVLSVLSAAALFVTLFYLFNYSRARVSHKNRVVVFMGLVRRVNAVSVLFEMAITTVGSGKS